jgi:hypothetical protein
LPVDFPLKTADAVFRYYVDKYGLDGDGDIHAIALFTYALVEKARIDFTEYSINILHKTPTAQDIEDWYAEKPPAYFDELSDRGLTWYSGFARILLEEEFEEHAKSAVRDAISENFDHVKTKIDSTNALIGTIHTTVSSETANVLGNLKTGGAWGRNFWIGFWAGVGANVAFTVLVLIFVFAIDRDFSFIGWAKDILHPPAATAPANPPGRP